MCMVKMFFIIIDYILSNPFESIRKKVLFAIKVNLLTGSTSNSFRNRGKSNWKSRLLLQLAVQADGTETERTVNLPEWRWSPTNHTRGRLLHCGWHFIYRYNHYSKYWVYTVFVLDKNLSVIIRRLGFFLRVQIFAFLFHSIFGLFIFKFYLIAISELMTRRFVYTNFCECIFSEMIPLHLAHPAGRKISYTRDVIRIIIRHKRKLRPTEPIHLGQSTNIVPREINDSIVLYFLRYWGWCKSEQPGSIRFTVC